MAEEDVLKKLSRTFPVVHVDGSTGSLYHILINSTQRPILFARLNLSKQIYMKIYNYAEEIK